MATRTALFLDTTTGSLKGISSTADQALVAGIRSGAATNLTLDRAGAAGTTVTIGAADVTYGSSLAALNVGSTTFALANTTATTVNLGGAATTINAGAAASTFATGFNAVTSSQASVALFNTTATTVNFAGAAATALNMGNSGGTTTINGSTVVSGTLAANGATITTDDATFALLNTTATTINFGGAATSINMGVGGGLTTVTGNARVTGNLTVVGTTFTTESETVLINDNHLYLNNAYTTAAAQTGGLVVNYLPTATATTVAAGGFATTSTIATTGAATFAAGDIFQVSGATNPENNGIYEVLTHAANVLTIDTSPTEDFLQNVFVVSVGAVGALTKVNVSVMRSGTDGLWEVAAGATTPFTFSDLATGAASGWTDDGATVRLTTSTDEVAIGTATALGKFTVQGDTAAQISQVIRMAAAQTADAFLMENSSGTDLLRIDASGNFLPGQDDNVTVGSASLRFSSVFAQAHSALAAVSDANPIVSLRRDTGGNGQVAFGPGGGTAVDTGLVRKGVGLLAPSNGPNNGAGHFVPHSDNSSNLGTTALRFGEVIGNQHDVYGTASDANPVISVRGSGTTGRVSFGPGGATALDTSMRRTGVRVLSFGDAGDTTGATLLPTGDTNGAVGTSGTRWGDGQFVTFTIGTLTIGTSVSGPLDILTERASDPGATANTGKLYTKDVSTITELFYQDSAGTVTQLTAGGVVSGAWTDDGAVVRLTTATDNVGIGTVTPGANKVNITNDTVGDRNLLLVEVAAQTAAPFRIETSGATLEFQVAVGGDTTTAGDLAVNGGDITTSAATATLFNATATTLSVGGAATALSMGAATGTLTIGNPTITGTNATTLNLNGASPSIATTSAATASVFNTNATTLNIGGAATTVNMGAAASTLATAFNTITSSAATVALFNTGTTAINIGGAATTTFGGAVVMNGNITLGNADTDDITVGGEFVSGLVPNVTNTVSLGSSTKRWANLFVTNLDSLSVGTTYVAASTITAARVVYKNATASEVAHADATSITSGSNKIVGVARAGAAATADVTVDYAGVVTMDAATGITITAGDLVYLSTAAGTGEVTNVAPSASGEVIVVVGVAKTTSASGGTFLAQLAPRTPFEIP